MVLILEENLQVHKLSAASFNIKFYSYYDQQLHSICRHTIEILQILHICYPMNLTGLLVILTLWRTICITLVDQSMQFEEGVNLSS